MPITFFDHVEFKFANFEFHLEALQEIFLPEYKGSTFRGGFGHIMKDVCCLMPPGRCVDRCLKPESCAYGYIFETPQTVADSAPIQSTNLPHPFVILPPITRQQYFAAGSELKFSLVLVGKGIEFLPFFIYAFETLGRRGLGKKRGRYKLQSVIDAFSQKQIYSQQSETLLGDFSVLQFSDFLMRSPPGKKQTLRLHFLTPTRILYRNKLVDRLPFELFIRNLLRRCSLLAQIHCQHVWDLDYKNILNLAENSVRTIRSNLTWYDWERYGPRQQRWMKLGGFIGEVIYQGNMAPFAPLIQLGQYIHLGKNSSFGMGKYQTEWL